MRPREETRYRDHPCIKASEKARDVVWPRPLRDDALIASAQAALQLLSDAARLAIKLSVRQYSSGIAGRTNKRKDKRLRVQRRALLQQFNQCSRRF